MDELFVKYRETGDIAIRNQIVEKYLYIASVIAKKFVGRGIEYDDLYQVAVLALIKGIDRFDPALGVQFSTFITPTITGEIKNHFRDLSRLVQLPRRVSELRAAMSRAEEALTAELGRKPTVREIAGKLGVSEEELVRAAEAGSVVSLDRAARDESDTTFRDLLPAVSDGALERVEDRSVVQEAMRGLKPAEIELLRYRYAEELSQVETAKRMGMSQMSVSRLERKLLDKLRENIKKGMAE